MIERIRDLASNGLRTTEGLLTPFNRLPIRVTRWLLKAAADALEGRDESMRAPAQVGAPARENSAPAPAPTIDSAGLAEALREAKPPLLLDVREPGETAGGVIASARLLPMRDVLSAIGELREDGRRIVVYCAHGVRSMNVVTHLRDRGVDAWSLTGGIVAWQAAGEPVAAPNAPAHETGNGKAVPATPAPTKAWVRVVAASDVAQGAGKVIQAGGKTLALFHTREDRWAATDNACRHRGGPLGEGELSGSVVTCPWHGWKYEVSTGASTSRPGVSVGCYPVKVEAGEVWIEV